MNPKKKNASAWASGYAIDQGEFDRFKGDHLANAVKFVSGAFGGFQFGGLYSFSNMPGDFQTGSAWSVGAQYQHGAFSMGIAWTQLNNPSGMYAFDPYAMIGAHSFFGRPTVSVDAATGTVTDLSSNTPFQVDRQGTFGIGACYAVGSMMLMGALTCIQLKAFSLAGGYQYTHFDAHHWSQLSAGMHYLFLKSIDISLSGDWLNASKGVDAVIGYSFTPSMTTTQADVRIGMRHSF
jgi:outer membrane protein OmpU